MRGALLAIAVAVASVAGPIAPAAAFGTSDCTVKTNSLTYMTINCTAHQSRFLYGVWYRDGSLATGLRSPWVAAHKTHSIYAPWGGRFAYILYEER